MAILNVTPDSFSDGGQFVTVDAALTQVERLVLAGADIIDVGCESSRPGSKSIDINSELDRLSFFLNAVNLDLNVCFSIDTYKYQVAEYALKNGFKMINDIYAGQYDDNKMFEVASKFDVPIVLMHMRGTPLDMQNNTEYNSVIDSILCFFDERISKAQEYGIPEKNIILDPGIGFGKKIEDNFKIIKNIDQFKSLGYKVLIGLSRKNFLIYKKDLPADRLSATVVMNSVSVLNGADIIRVHDVLENIKMVNILKQYVSC